MITVSDYGALDLGLVPRATKPDAVLPFMYTYEHVFLWVRQNGIRVILNFT